MPGGGNSHFLFEQKPVVSPNRKPAQDGARSWMLTEMPLWERGKSDPQVAATPLSPRLVL